MELALILLLLVIFELAITVWMLAKHRDYLRRVTNLEKKLAQNGTLRRDGTAADPAIAAPAPVDVEQIRQMAADASPEEIAQAQAILEALGIKA